MILRSKWKKKILVVQLFNLRGPSFENCILVLHFRPHQCTLENEHDDGCPSVYNIAYMHLYPFACSKCAFTNTAKPAALINNI